MAGRKTKYSKEFNTRAHRLCLLGLTDVQLADAFGINPQTLYNWQDKHTTFRAAIQRGKKEADSHVVHALYKKAIGYSHPDVHISNHKGEITITDIIKHYPPDTGACIFWLKNRQRDNWRDINSTELTGRNGGPIEHKIDLDDFTDDELKQMHKMGMKLRGGNGHQPVGRSLDDSRPPQGGSGVD